MQPIARNLPAATTSVNTIRSRGGRDLLLDDRHDLAALVATLYASRRTVPVGELMDQRPRGQGVRPGSRAAQPDRPPGRRGRWPRAPSAGPVAGDARPITIATVSAPSTTGCPNSPRAARIGVAVDVADVVGDPRQPDVLRVVDRPAAGVSSSVVPGIASSSHQPRCDAGDLRAAPAQSPSRIPSGSSMGLAADPVGVDEVPEARRLRERLPSGHRRR